jgi:DNA end-binding protein Ku
MLNQMRYQQEVKEIPDVAIAEKTSVSEKEMELAVQLIDSLTQTFDPAAFKDTYINELKKIIKAKAAGKHIRIAEPEAKPAVPVKDLMEILKRSLEKGKKRA